MTQSDSRGKLVRTTFRTSRLLDFCNQKELIAQTGHQPDEWPLVLAKEVIDNALDACEDASLSPILTVTIDDGSVTIEDNGPGIPPETVRAIQNFSIRVSSREAYVSPCRGAQGNALKTVLAMPFVLDGNQGQVEIEARRVRHLLTFSVDRIRQEPKIDHQQDASERTSGTKIRVCWPSSAIGQNWITENRVFYKLPRITPS